MTPRRIGDAPYRRALALWGRAAGSPLEAVRWPSFDAAGVRLLLKRDERLHPGVSGNKWRKLLPQVAWLLRGGARGFATVGGTHSNHLAAVAALCGELGVPCRGYVRARAGTDADHAVEDTPTTAAAAARGMDLRPASRERVRAWRESAPGPELLDGLAWLPEGGTSALALLGVSACWREIRDQIGRGSPLAGIGVAVGSGGTALGLARVAGCPVYATSVVADAGRAGRLAALTERYARAPLREREYGRPFASGEPRLYRTLRAFAELNDGLALDPLYTAKALLGLERWLEEGAFRRGDTAVLVHTGGLQGRGAWLARYGYPADASPRLADGGHGHTGVEVAGE